MAASAQSARAPDVGYDGHMNEESQQLHFRYSTEEDRIMAFIRGEGGNEHVFELTRRVIKALWPQLAARVGAASEAVKKATESMVSGQDSFLST